jgi:hypothetical protein
MVIQQSSCQNFWSLAYLSSAYLTENTCLILPVPLATCTSGRDVQTFAIPRRALVSLKHELVCNCERFLGPDLHELELGLP